jgi:hypothetical protein
MTTSGQAVTVSGEEKAEWKTPRIQQLQFIKDTKSGATNWIREATYCHVAS